MYHVSSGVILSFAVYVQYGKNDGIKYQICTDILASNMQIIIYV